MTNAQAKAIFESLPQDLRLELMGLVDNQAFQSLYEQELELTNRKQSSATFLEIGLQYLNA